jgi:GAF domain-containing protein
MDAVWEHEVISSPDLATEARWPTWGPRVVSELGVRSMLCIQLFTSNDHVGALNLYSRQVRAFDDIGDRLEAQALAAHVAVALVAAQEIEQLSEAVGTRTVIGQAEGILMERFDIGASQAFEVLKRVSSHSNVKLHAVAVELVLTRNLPGQMATRASARRLDEHRATAASPQAE